MQNRESYSKQATSINTLLENNILSPAKAHPTDYFSKLAALDMNGQILSSAGALATFRRLLFHVATIYSNKNATILLEEPESHSFPPYVKELSELIKNDENDTYFITTHSPYFFNSMVEDSKTIKDISFFHVYYEDYQTKIKKLTDKEIDNIWGSGADVFFNIDSFIK